VSANSVVFVTMKPRWTTLGGPLCSGWFDSHRRSSTAALCFVRLSDEWWSHLGLLSVSEPSLCSRVFDVVHTTSTSAIDEHDIAMQSCSFQQ